MNGWMEIDKMKDGVSEIWEIYEISSPKES